jgi:hypothetical protein
MYEKREREEGERLKPEGRERENARRARQKGDHVFGLSTRSV